YQQIHVNIIVYDSTSRNVQLALPNKLYESLAFMRPIVCASNCALSERVQELEVGVSADSSNLEKSIDLIFSDYNFFKEKISLLPDEFYLDNLCGFQGFI